MGTTSGRLRVVFAAAMLVCAAAARAQTRPSLGVAGSFVALGGTKVVDAGGSTLTGNVGASPGNTVTVGRVLLGDIHRDDDVARQAQRDNAAAYAELDRQPCGQAMPLAGTLEQGVYCFPSSAHLNGRLTLHGDADAVFIFNVTGTLTTDGGSAILLDGGAISSNVFWRVTDSATLGESSAFIGTILARNDITMKKGVTMSGRALAQTGSVLLDGDAVTICCDPIRIEPATLPGAKVGVSYTVPLTAIGGTPPYAFSLGVHPDGMTISPNNELSWTPAAEGSYDVAVTATDKNGCPGVQQYVLLVCDTIVLSALPPLPPPSPLCPLTRQLAAGGGKAPYAFSGSPPAGTTLSSQGVLTGAPSTPGCSTFTVTATDSLGCTGQRDYTMCGLSIAPETLPDGVVGMPYSAQIVPAVGTPPYQCSACGLPSWLTLENCLLSGTPPETRTYEFTITVIDSNAGAGSRNYVLKILACPIVFSPASPLPDASECVSYDQTIRASGGAAPYKFAVSGLPLGLTPTFFADSVRLTGTPHPPGQYKITITATDDAGCVHAETYDLTVVSKLAPMPGPLPCATRGSRYAAQLPLPSGGKPPYAFVLTSGALPNGLALSAGGSIFGTPAANATSSVIGVTITDALSCSVVEQITICICLTVAAPPPATVNVPYSQKLQVSGGSGSYSFAPVAGFPDWLKLDADGTLHGVPPAEDTLQLTVSVTDTITPGCSDTPTIPLPIGPCALLPISPASTALAEGTVFMAYGPQALVASGGTPPYTYAVPAPPAPPPGITLSSGGVLSGVPTTTGRFNFSVQATDSKGVVGCPQVYSIVIGPAMVPPAGIPLLSPWVLVAMVLSLLTIAVGVLRRTGGT